MIDVLLELRRQGNSRRDRWHTPDTEPWSGADWSNAMCGEAGEAANIVKKLRRIETGTGSADGPGSAELTEALAHELADTIAYADLLAQHYGIDLREAIATKFNVVSEREGFPERIDLAADPVSTVRGMCRYQVADLETHLRGTSRSAPDHRPCETAARAKFAEKILAVLDGAPDA